MRRRFSASGMTQSLRSVIGSPAFENCLKRLEYFFVSRDRASPSNCSDETTKAKFETKRQAIVRGKLGFGEFLESEGLWCDLSRIIYFFHRVTPEFYPMRFDTRFYLASLPAHQTSLSRSEEVTHSLWIKPAEALSQVDRHDFPILPPTTTVLEDLAEIHSWDDLCARYRLG